MEHTPGPWEAEGMGGIQMDGSRDGYVITSTDVRQIARLTGINLDRRINQANAYLITAAPDMLEALEELAERCESCNDEEKHHEGLQCWLCMECSGFRPRAKARAAIAKAKGEA